jgi:hypothetical protein
MQSVVIHYVNYFCAAKFIQLSGHWGKPGWEKPFNDLMAY